jgi:arsenate reductase (thioredoxin)
MQNILILCTGNSCRSQIAHGYLHDFLNNKNINIYSAGIETHGVNSRAIATMLADGIDISAHTSNNVDEYRDLVFSHVITVCDNANERCPVFPSSARKLHYNFPDPAKAQGSEAEIVAQFAAVRGLIKAFCAGFSGALNP